MTSLVRKKLSLALVATVALTGALVTPPPAHAEEVADGGYLNNFNGFYKNPVQVPAQPAQVIRTQPFSGTLTYTGGEQAGEQVNGIRVMYTTTSALGEQLPVTGKIFNTSNKWEGRGETPSWSLLPAHWDKATSAGQATRLGSFSP
ncbi:MAG: hypothetical protein WAN89_08165 [Lawsonella sp.]|nr:hypothetical protein [Mycobacteriales bacterium]